MKLLAPAIALLYTLAIGACAPLWLDPIRKVGPDTYQVTHTMYKMSPTKGVRSGLTDRAREKCADMGKPYTKLREEMTPGGALSYTLTFQCAAEIREF